MCEFPTVNMVVAITDHTVFHGPRLIICCDTESMYRPLRFIKLDAISDFVTIFHCILYPAPHYELSYVTFFRDYFRPPLIHDQMV